MEDSIIIRNRITVAGWQNGFGFTYTNIFCDEIIKIPSAELKQYLQETDWDWWESDDGNDDDDDTDTLLSVSTYRVFDDGKEDSLISYKEKWASAIKEERCRK